MTDFTSRQPLDEIRFVSLDPPPTDADPAPEPDSEPYVTRYHVRMGLADGVTLGVYDDGPGIVRISIYAPGSAPLSIALTDDENNRLRSTLLNAAEAAGRRR